MRRNSSLRIACAIAALVLISFVCITCGGSSHSNLSQAQAQAISQEVFSTLRTAMVTGLTAPGSAAATPPSLPEIVERAQAAQPSGCVISSSGELCNIPIYKSS
jgi:hypothetical protein